MERPGDDRLAALMRTAARRRLDAVLLFDEANVRALTGVACDNCCLALVRAPTASSFSTVFITDFRYVPMVHRVAPGLKTVELARGVSFAAAAKDVCAKARAGQPVRRIGYEGTLATWRYLELRKEFPRATLVDVDGDVKSLRAVKTVEEITRIAAAEALNDEIWARAQKDIRPNMTEKDIQRVIRAWMNALGDGEAFETIVCAGANAAECHHVPDGTVWRKGEPLLVDMGVKLDGVCSDMTRCLKPSRSPDPEYDRVYDIVLEANRAAIAAARPAMTTGALDKVARDIIRKAGYAKALGHSLGHGVGYEIHELPMARPKDGTVLEPGMLVTIEPGIYLEGRLGVRIEDLVLITTTGCEVLSHSRK